MEFSRDLGIQNIILEGDALNIIQALQKERQALSWYGQLIDDAKTVYSKVSNHGM